MELNAEQIVKQMQEWCDNMCENACLKGESLNGKVHTCEICFPNTVKNALALIKELNEENERLRAEKETFEIYYKDYKYKNKELAAFNRRWAKECAELQDECDQIKSDTVRKMQERITEYATNGYPRKVRLDVIDRIVEEMVDG